MKMSGYYVIWSNEGGDLERRHVKTCEDAAKAAIEMILEAGELYDGDTIRVIEG
jgi:hypothetical protein